MCVEWLPSGSKAECNEDMRRELAFLGFKDASLGVEPQLPVEIAESARASVEETPSLEAGLAQLLTEAGHLLPDDNGNGHADNGDAGDGDASEDDWMELLKQ
jgi:hypothetical protein